jgi:hypothetical protein
MIYCKIKLDQISDVLAGNGDDDDAEYEDDQAAR